MAEAVVRNLMRDRAEGHQRVTNVELFFDLVYVFAVTQLSHYLLPRPTVDKALQGQPLQRNFQRILAWCCVSGALAIAGGLTSSVYPRALFWLLAAGVDLLGGVLGFYTPGLGRSTTQQWDIEGGHFAERCQGFILIALGESIVVIGATLALLHRPLALPHADRAPTVAAFVVAFAGSAALWWLYFDRSAGGLYIAGHLAFKLTVWRRLSWQRIWALVALALLGLLAPHVSALVLSACVAAVIVAVAIADQVQFRSAARGET